MENVGDLEISESLPAPLYMERRDGRRNMARFYRVSVERDLYGTLMISRCFGRIGTRGRVLSEAFACEGEASLRVAALSNAKRRRGYVILNTAEIQA